MPRNTITTADIQALETSLAEQFKAQRGEVLDENDPRLVTVASLANRTGDSQAVCRKWLYQQEQLGALERVAVRKIRGGGTTFGWRKPSK